MRGLVVLCLILSMVAGCIAGDEPAQPATVPLASPDDVGMRPGNATQGDEADGVDDADGEADEADGAHSGVPAEGEATVPVHARPIEGGTMLASVSSDAAVAGYALDVPPDAAHSFYGDSSYEIIALSIAPVFASAPEAMTVTLYDLDVGRLLFSYLMIPFEGTSYLTAALTTDLSDEAYYEPTTMFLSEDLEGERLGVVVAAQGLDGPAGVLLRFDEELQVNDEARTVEELEDAGVWSPLPIGTGGGMSYGIVQEAYYGLYAPAGLYGLEVFAGDHVVEDRTSTWVPPHGGVRDATVGVTAEGAWSYGVFLHLAGEGATEWSFNGKVAGIEHEDDGYLAWGNGLGYSGTALVFGAPIMLGEGDGGGAAFDADLYSASTNDIYVNLALAFAYDAPLEDLIGVRAAPQVYTYEGLVTLDRERDVLEVGGAAHRIAGLDL